MYIDNTTYLYVNDDIIVDANRSYQQKQEMIKWENAVEEAIGNLQRIFYDQKGNQVHLWLQLL
jgi:hypothetical protein